MAQKPVLRGEVGCVCIAHVAEPRRCGEWGGGRAGFFEHRNEGPGNTRVPPRLPLGDT